MSTQEMVREFNQEKLGGKPTVELAYDNMIEELNELVLAIAGGNKRDILKEMCDVEYTMRALAEACGWDYERAFVEVHRSNMSKEFSDDGTKVRKGPQYSPPDLSDCV